MTVRLHPWYQRGHPEEAAAVPQGAAAAASHRDNPRAVAAVVARQTAGERTPEARQRAAAVAHAEVAQNRRKYEELR